MQEHTEVRTGANILILEKDRAVFARLDGWGDWSLGRCGPEEDQKPDLPLFSRIASRDHGEFHRRGRYWIFAENPKNLNGTFYNGRKIPKHPRGLRQPVLLSPGDTLRIDNDRLNHRDGVLILFTNDSFSEFWIAFDLSERPVTVIGRDMTCDIAQPESFLSPRHAKITALNGVYYLSDCGSETGTFCNGERISGTVILAEKDHIRLCDHSYFFIQGKLIYCE
jgi:pSer/pThr/pTyr-binding forkhead associated (FHA) protein